MNEDKKENLTPLLRFPAFKNKESWAAKEVGEVFQVSRGNVLAMSLVNENWSEEAPYPVYSSQTKDSGLAGYFREYLFENAITWTTDGANAGDVNYRSGKFYCTNVCGVLISIDGHANPCISALINSVSKKYVSYVGNPKLMNGVMSKIRIPIPSLEEQQKIADCLSSVDELITAENQKLEALKQHKKGLMQQLFPAEGERVPKLRFKEFRDSGEWDIKTLEKICEINPSVGYIPEQFVYIDLESVENGTLLKKKLTTRKEAPSRAQRLLRLGDVIFQMVRPYQRNNYFFDPNDTFEYVASTGYSQLRALNSPLYLYQYVNTQRFVNRVIKKCTGSNYPAINSSDLSKIIVEVPGPQEQERIASLLFTIDNLITGQTGIVKLLMKHKRGLMQQLFPLCMES